MKKPIYLINDGELKREDNTIVFIKNDAKQSIPVNTISEIYAFGEISLNKRVLELLDKYHIPIFFYNYYGQYVGCYYPKHYINSGLMVIKQVEVYLDKKRRLYLAKGFLFGASLNILKNLKYYGKSKKRELTPYIEDIDQKLKDIDNRHSISSLMALEGDIRKMYYEAFNKIIDNEEFHMEKRVKRPPDSPINAMISFGNALLYSTVLAQIYRTRLEPRIGFLHENNRRSLNLHLDISEIFKPIIVDRVIFSLVNKSQIKKKHFDISEDKTYLNDDGKKIFIKAFEEKLNTTIKHKQNDVSYRKLIRMECYKLYTYFLEDEPYAPFITNW